MYLYEGNHRIWLEANPSKFPDHTGTINMDYLLITERPAVPACTHRLDIGDATMSGGGPGSQGPLVGQKALGWTDTGHLINFASHESGDVTTPAFVEWTTSDLSGPVIAGASLNPGTVKMRFHYALDWLFEDVIKLNENIMHVRHNGNTVKEFYYLPIISKTVGGRLFRDSDDLEVTFSGGVNTFSIESVSTKPGAFIDYLELYDETCAREIFCEENPDDC